MSQYPAETVQLSTLPVSRIMHPDISNPVPSSPVSKIPRAIRDLEPQFPCVVYQCDNSLKLVDVSPNVANLLHIDSVHLADTRSFSNDRVHHEDLESVAKKFNELEMNGFASFIHRIIDDRGLPIWIAHSISKELDSSNGNVRGCIVPLIEEDRCHELSHSIVSRFIHKIGNHFQLINLLVDPLTTLLPESRERVSLQQAIDKTIGLLRGFSEFCQKPSSMTEIEFYEVLKGIFSARKSLFFQKKVDFQFHADDSIRRVVLNTDPFLLDTAIGHILQNALEATGKGGRVVLEVRAEKVNETGSSVIIVRIVDSGSGIEPDNLGKALLPFFTTKSNHDGLGLSLASRFIELHGGILRVDSTPEKGTEINITLPVLRGAASF